MSHAWPMVPLDDVLTQYQEYIESLEPRIYPKLSVRLYGKGVVLDVAADGSTLRMKRHQIAKAGQVILSEIWGKKGAIGFVPTEGNGALCTSHFFLFDISAEKIEPKYLQAVFKANYLEDQLGAEAKGTTGYAAVRSKNLLAAQIPLPPLDEQRRIVARIEALAAKIEEARALRQAGLQQTATLSLAVIDTKYRQLASRSGTRKLADMCKAITDGDHVTPRFAESGVAFIFVGNVSSGHLHFKGIKRVSSEYFERLRPQRVPKRGDILYSAVCATLGIPAVVDCDEPFCFQRHVAILKPDRAQVDSRFLWYMLSSRTVFTKAWSSTTGSAQPTVPLRAIRELRVPQPPIAEQRRTVAELDSRLRLVDRLTRLQAETAAELDALLPSILDKAFKGEL